MGITPTPTIKAYHKRLRLKGSVDPFKYLISHFRTINIFFNLRILDIIRERKKVKIKP